MEKNNFLEEVIKNNKKTSDKLDQILKHLGGENNIESFSITENKMIIEVSNLKEVNLKEIEKELEKDVKSCPALVSFDLSDELLNLIIKILVSNGDFEFNYKNLKPYNDTDLNEEHEFVNPDILNNPDYRYYDNEHKQEELNQVIKPIPTISNLNQDSNTQSINYDDKRILTIDDYIQFDYSNRSLLWQEYARQNQTKQICNICDNHENWTTINLSNGSHICYHCWLRKPTYNDVIKLSNFKRKVIQSPIKHVMPTPITKVKTVNRTTKPKKSELVKQETKSIIIKKANRKWISKGLVENNYDK